MICNNCFSQIPDGETICPYCKKRVAKKRFQINIPEEKLNEEVPVRPEQKSAEPKAEETQSDKINAESALPKEEKAEIKKPEFSKAENIVFKPEEKAPVAAESAKSQKVPAPVPTVKTAPAPKPVQKTANGEPQVKKVAAEPKMNPAQAKKEKGARAAVLSICSVCAAIMIALCFVSKYTDIFKTSGEAVKTVALSGFSHSEKSSFENYASFFTAFFETGFNRDDATQQQLLEMMEPQSKSGLYSAFFKAAQVVTDEADPADRFKTETGYSYCKIKKANIEKIMTSLGQEAVNCANGKDFYFYNGYYYFSASENSASGNGVYSLEIASSKRTEDGNYYVECAFTNKKGEKKTVYCLASLEKSDEGNKWSLLELSSSPLFSEDGVKIIEEITESLSFTIERKTIQAKTKKGILFANYVVEYPVFSAADDDEDGKRAAATLNTLYNEMISKYEAKAKRATRLYKRYLELGGKKKDLPAYAYVSSKVTYNKNGYISLLEETNEYLPLFSRFEENKAKAEENGESVSPSILLPTTTFEGYTLDIKSGEFLKKDSVLGKDYYSIQQKLFELYLQKNDLISETDETLPSDDENIGQLINSSSWCISENGILFSFIDPKGYNDSVVLPFTDIPDSEIKF